MVKYIFSNQEVPGSNLAREFFFKFHKKMLKDCNENDRSKAVVPVFSLFCVALWFILRGASWFKVFSCSFSSCFFIPFSIVITSFGEEGARLCASRAFVCLFCTS